MSRISRSNDYYPRQLRYQYRYFQPTQVVPYVQGTEAPRTHICGTSAPEHGCLLWNKIGTCGGSAKSGVRDYGIKKTLPKTARAVEEVRTGTGSYTGKGLRYSSTADILGTPMMYKFPDLVTASNICASHANKTHVGEKFSPHEWSYNNQQLYAGAECVHNTVMMMGADAKNCIEETQKDQVRCATDTSKDMEKRLYDVQKWLEKEKMELSYNISQSHELLELKERVELMIKNLETPLNITQENLYSRESRPGIELVKDPVEEALLNEVHTFRTCDERLHDQLNQIISQLSQLRAARHELEKDIRNKSDARSTDESAKLLCGLNSEIGSVGPPFDHIAKSSPASWLQNSQALIQRSQDERQTSQTLYGEVTRVMMMCADHCFNSWYETNSCLGVRVKEVANARDQLQQQYNKINHDIEILNRKMNEVRKALDDKKPSLKLAQARAQKRTQRPGLELCHDKVSLALLKEIHALQVSIDKLALQYDDMETTMQHLMKAKGMLEKDLKLKNAAMFIDREKCLQLRQSFPVSTFKDSLRPPTGVKRPGFPQVFNQV